MVRPQTNYQNNASFNNLTIRVDNNELSKNSSYQHEAFINGNFNSPQMRNIQSPPTTNNNFGFASQKIQLNNISMSNYQSPNNTNYYNPIMNQSNRTGINRNIEPSVQTNHNGFSQYSNNVHMISSTELNKNLNFGMIQKVSSGSNIHQTYQINNNINMNNTNINRNLHQNSNNNLNQN